MELRRIRRSAEADDAVEEGILFMAEESPDQAKAQALDLRLRGLLTEDDPFWIRWRYVGEQQGWLKRNDDITLELYANRHNR